VLSAAAELEIDLGAIVANWRDLCTRHPSGPVGSVVKADGYGLGAARVAPALYDAGCRQFFVAHLAEALALRPLLPDAMLAALNGLLPGDAPRYAEQGILPALGSLAEIDAWRDTGRGPALLHVDTGMNRLGLSPDDVEALVADPGRLGGVELRYIMTHLASSEVADDKLNELQRSRFAETCERLGLQGVPRSFANSSGIFLGAGFGSDLARPGAALYGVNPTPGRPNTMRPVVRLRARVLRIRHVPRGESVGYNGTWIAARDSVIGTVSVGYADGFLRSLSNRAVACFDGARVPLVGRVSMDLSTFDLTGLSASVGDWLELIGPRVPVDEVATAAGTNGYEILTSLGPRYRRVYLEA
jgi:alanine racemase